MAEKEKSIMKSKTVKLISGVAVLAVLSGTYIGVTSYVDSQEEKEAEAADTSVSVVEMDSEKITSVSFNGTEGAEEVFEKDGDRTLIVVLFIIVITSSHQNAYQPYP